MIALFARGGILGMADRPVGSWFRQRAKSRSRHDRTLLRNPHRSAKARRRRCTPTRDINFRLEEGARHALIGPNGAGKTTFINLLTGVLHADATAR